MAQEQTSGIGHKSFLTVRFWLLASGLGLAAAAAGVAVWVARKPLAEAAVGAALRSRGAEGSLRVEAVGVDSILMRDVRLGPAERPTFTAERIALAYRLDPAAGQMVLERLTIEGATLVAAVSAGKIDLGALAPFLEPADGPPRVRITNVQLSRGRIVVETPQGQVVMAADAKVDLAQGGAAQVSVLAAPPALAPSYRAGAIRIDLAAGPARPQRGIGAVVRLDDVALQADPVRANGVSGALRFTTLLPETGLPGAVQAAGRLTARAIDTETADASTLTLTVRDLELTALRPDWSDLGVRIDARADAAAVEALGWRGRGVRLEGVGARAAGDALRWAGEASAEGMTGPGRLAGGGLLARLDALRTTQGAVSGAWSVRANGLSAPDGAVEAASAEGRLALAWPEVGNPSGMSGKASFRLTAERVRPTSQFVRGVAAQARTAPAPADRALAALAEAAGRGASVSASGALDLDGRGGAVLSLDAGEARSGTARLEAANAAAPVLRADLAAGRITAAGQVLLRGGGLPQAEIALTRLQLGGGQIQADGVARIAPYATSGVEASAERLVFAVRGPSAWPAVSVSGSASVTGMIGGARLERAALMLDIEANGAGLRLARCTELALAGIRQGAMQIGPARARLCPERGPLRLGAGRIAGAGRLELSPLTIASGPDASTRLTTGPIRLRARPDGALAFTAAPESATTLADGGVITTQAALDGLFTLGRAADWTLEARTDALTAQGFGAIVSGGGVLRARSRDGAVTGGLEAARLSLADTQSAQRFGAVQAEGAITFDAAGAQGRFALATAQGKPLGAADIAHSFAAGAGTAAISLDRLAFTRRGLQPDELFPALKGVVAEVEGVLDARIALDWGGDRAFTARATAATAQMDFATGLGPVERVSGAVEISDLLTLTSPPGQTLSIGRFNPGVPIEAGLFQFSLPGGPRVQIEDARWPFAGGLMVLKPDLWDIGAPSQTLTMELREVNLQRLVELLRIPDLQTAGTVEGAFPVVVENGVARIEGGRLASKTGGGLIRYTGAMAQAAASAGPGAGLAFEALRNLEFELLEMTVDGPLTGELTIGLLFQGKNPDVMEGYPFRFNVRATGPFAQLAQALGGIQRQGQAIGERVRDLIEQGPSTPPPAAGQSAAPPPIDPPPPPAPQ